MNATDIIQTYLISNEIGLERRIRQRGIAGDYNFYYTEKRVVADGTREEREKIISYEEYIDLMAEADTGKKQIRKTRYCFIYKNKYFELDIYPNWKDEAILEIEVNDINEDFIIPEDIQVIKEVTNDTNYSNFGLASKQ